MLIYFMSVSVDGFIADRKGGFGWSRFPHLEFRLSEALSSRIRYRPDAAIGPDAEPDPTDPTAITVGRFAIRLP